MEKENTNKVKEQIQYIILYDLVDRLQHLLSSDEKNKDKVKHYINDAVERIMYVFENTQLAERLNILYEYQQHNLNILKEYKEEIKFAATLQEDLRKERAKFFGETLKDVSITLKEAVSDENAKRIWIKELVESYTQSLDMSGKLVDERTIETMNEINKGVNKGIDEIKNSNKN